MVIDLAITAGSFWSPANDSPPPTRACSRFLVSITTSCGNDCAGVWPFAERLCSATWAAAVGDKASAVQLTGTQRLGVKHLAKATASCWRYCQSKCASAHGTALLKQEAIDVVNAQLIEEVSCA